jgi:hypothetical protein
MCERVNQMEANRGHRGDRTLDRTRSLFDRTRLVSVQRLHVSQFSDRTRWRVRSWLTGHVRSLRVLTRLQPDTGTVAFDQFYSASSRCFVGALLRLDQRVRSVTGPARLVVLHASGLRDQRVRSARLLWFRVPNGSIRRGMSINTRWSAQSSYSCTL